MQLRSWHTDAKRVDAGVERAPQPQLSDREGRWRAGALFLLAVHFYARVLGPALTGAKQIAEHPSMIAQVVELVDTQVSEACA